VPAVPMSSVRASSGVPWKTSLYSNPSRGTSTNESTEPAISAASTAIPGSTHSDPRTYSATSSRHRLLPASPNIRSREWSVERIVQSVIYILLHRRRHQRSKPFNEDGSPTLQLDGRRVFRQPCGQGIRETTSFVESTISQIVASDSSRSSSRCRRRNEERTCCCGPYSPNRTDP
jgi:hypothetical protein